MIEPNDANTSPTGPTSRRSLCTARSGASTNGWASSAIGRPPPWPPQRGRVAIVADLRRGDKRVRGPEPDENPAPDTSDTDCLSAGRRAGRQRLFRLGRGETVANLQIPGDVEDEQE